MNKEQIVKSAKTSWDDQCECFVTRSPKADYLSGGGETKEEAYTEFLAHLEIHYEEYLKNNHGVLNARRAGRPKSGRVDYHTKLKPEAKAALVEIATAQKKTMPEVLEILIFNAQQNKIAL